MILTQQDSEKNLLRFVAQAVEFLGPFKDVRHLRGGPLVGRHGRFGYLVVGAKEEPAAGDRFVLHVLAQQAGVALAKFHLHGGNGNSRGIWAPPTSRCGAAW